MVSKESKDHERSSSILKLHNDKFSHSFRENLVIHHEDSVWNEYELDLAGGTTVLGSGVTGKVYRIRKITNPKAVYAIKQLKIGFLEGRKLKELQTEVSVLKFVNHSHIARLYESYETIGSKLQLVIELCAGGELFDRLMSLNKFPEDRARGIIAQMLSAIQYLHSKGIVHRDLKLENWLFRNDSDEVVLIDFGMSHRYADSEVRNKKPLTATVGTSYYIAPEVLDGKYSSVCDMWSLGVIAYMLLCGKAPFGGTSDPEILKNVMNGEMKMVGLVWDGISDDAKDFIAATICRNPDKRLHSFQALHHPWMAMARHLQPFTLPKRYVDILKAFTKKPEIKRRALNIIAYTIPYEARAEAMRFYDQIDNDDNGLITLKELKASIDAKDATNEEVEGIFQAVNMEETGVICCNELVAALLVEEQYLNKEFLEDAFKKLSDGKRICNQSLENCLGKEYTQLKAEAMLTEALSSFPQKKPSLFVRILRSVQAEKAPTLTLNQFQNIMQSV